jgi:hypothetical protein
VVKVCVPLWSINSPLLINNLVPGITLKLDVGMGMLVNEVLYRFVFVTRKLLINVLLHELFVFVQAPTNNDADVKFQSEDVKF